MMAAMPIDGAVAGSLRYSNHCNVRFRPEAAMTPSNLCGGILYRFSIYNGDALIGWSDFESGDAPMGVAFGKSIPAPGYEAIRSVVVDLRGKDDGVLRLSARLADGTVLDAIGGVHIEDHSDELGEDGREVAALGIGYPSYETLFPEHVAAYHRQFSTPS